MSEAIEIRPLAGRSGEREKLPVLGFVGLSGVAMTCQVAMTDYGASNEGAARVWFVAGGLLLLLVYCKRSRWARKIIVVTSLLGAIIFGLEALGNVHSVLLAAAFLAQAVPLMSWQVRSHVGARA